MDLLQKGWECPKCGAVMSPITSVCVNCRGFTEVSISTKSTNFIPATDSKDYPPYLDRPKGFNFQKEKGGEEICDTYNAKAVADAIANTPTADVVPKSEVFLASSDATKKLLELHGYAVTHDADVKKEVAREIFEEIERFLYLHFRFCKEEIGNDDTEYVKGRMELNTQIQNFIAELKKKYTEGK